MSIKELLKAKLLEYINDYGIITGIEKWEKYIKDINCKILNNFVISILYKLHLHSRMIWTRWKSYSMVR